jgi:hypothetical protein
MKIHSLILIFIAMLSATSAFADQQSDAIKQIRDGGPTANFSQLADQTDPAYYDMLMALADADAMVYVQDHKDLKDVDCMELGKLHAYKHHLIGENGLRYAAHFALAFNALTSKD